MPSIFSAASLGSALQNNVLSIQQAQREIEVSQNRLSTGNRVNSVLDNASSFITSVSLSNRASGLNSLLDAISTNISNITQASDAVTSLLDLIDTAEGIADDASTTLSGSTLEATLSGTTSLSSITDLPNEISNIDDGDILAFRFINDDGTFNTANSVTISNGDSITDLINNINAIQDTATNIVFEASLNTSGGLDIKTRNNTRFEVEFQTPALGANEPLAIALGFDDFQTEVLNDGATEFRITTIAEPAITTNILFEQNGGFAAPLATLATNLTNLTDDVNGFAGDIFAGDASDSIQISINGGSAIAVTDITGSTVSDFLDGINNNTSLNTQIGATFNATTGEITIRSLDPDVESIQILLQEDAAGAGTAGQIDLQRLGVGLRVLQSAVDGSANVSSESIQLNAIASTLATSQTEFDDVLTQIDELVNDAAIGNVNLLNGDNVTTSFNREGTSTLTTEGVLVTSTGLGLGSANFSLSSTIADSIRDIEDAESIVSQFSSSLSTDLTIIESRETFTSATITNLEGLVDDLTAVDENEESARLLSLQSQELLGVTTLALSTQSQSALLRLF